MTAPQHTVTPSDGVGHTPGPWEVGQHPALRNGWIVRPVLFGSHGWVLKPREGGHFVLRNEANAHLIAAAPDLLEALRYYMSQFGQALECYGIPYGPAQCEADERARAAIAKATGKTGGDA